MAFVKTVQRYELLLYPNHGRQGARIELQCDDHRLQLIFVDPAEIRLPANAFDAQTRTGVAHQPFSQYANYVDLLRSGQQVAVRFELDESPPTFVVQCSAGIPGVDGV